MTLTYGNMSVWQNFGRFLSVLVIFFLVLLATYLTTRWIAGYQRSQLHNRNLQVVETLRLTNNRYIQIIRAGDVYLVIGISRDHIEKLAELTKDQLTEISATDFVTKKELGENFRDVLEKVKQHLPKK